jgi:hypothetical protein
MTPIDYASHYGQLEIIQLFLNFLQENFYVIPINSALIHSISTKRYNIICELLKYQIAYIDIETALCFAYQCKDKFAISMLTVYMDE